MYAPIPFVGQSLRPGMQNPVVPPTPQNTNQEGVYMDDTRNVKRAKIEPKRISLDNTDNSRCVQRTDKDSGKGTVPQEY
jgi:hypothetical protein